LAKRCGLIAAIHKGVLMRRRPGIGLCYLSCAFLLMLAGPNPAGSQGAVANPGDIKAIQDCLKASKNNKGEVCLGKVVDLCIPGQKDVPMQQLTKCAARESAAWDGVLSGTYQDLSVQIDADMKPKLAAEMASWKSARDATCDFFCESACRRSCGIALQHVPADDHRRPCLSD
jgi:uncharacterized protein YecT (DUF1311 family)